MSNKIKADIGYVVIKRNKEIIEEAELTDFSFSDEVLNEINYNAAMTYSGIIDDFFIENIDIKKFMKNPIIVKNFDINKPIGKILSIKRRKNKIYFKAEINKNAIRIVEGGDNNG